MWIKCNLNKYIYDPYLINLNTGARIYIEQDEKKYEDGIEYTIYYDIPNSDDVFPLKSKLIPVNYFADDSHYDKPLSVEIDRLFEEIQKGKNFDFCY